MSTIRLAVTENVLSDPAKVTLQMYHDYMHALGRAWVCEADGQVAGFCYAVKEDGSIWALFVEPRHEGLGIASGLLTLACDWLRSIGIRLATLSTGADTRADGFYGARGWRRGPVNANNQVDFTLDLT